MQIDALVERISTVADEKQAQNIRAFQMSDDYWVADYVMVMSAKNQLHCKALVDDLVHTIQKELIGDGADEFFNPIKMTGSVDSGWVILDFNAIIVHCVSEDVRDFYGLDTMLEKQGIVYHY